MFRNRLGKERLVAPTTRRYNSCGFKKDSGSKLILRRQDEP